MLEEMKQMRARALKYSSYWSSVAADYTRQIYQLEFLNNPMLETLTEREKEIFEKLGSMSTEEIGSALGLNRKTVDSHRDSIRKKLRLKSAKDLAILSREITGFSFGEKTT